MTTWLEVIWVLDLNDYVQKWILTAAKAPAMFDSPGEIEPMLEWKQTFAEVRKICTKLEALHNELGSLKKDWGSILRYYPNRVWGDTISAYADSKFFFKTRATTVTIAPPTADSTGRSILIASQVSLEAVR